MYVELWDLKSNNLIADFDMEAQALASVRAEVARGGRAGVASWALLVTDDSGATITRAARSDLVRLAVSVPA